ncbi:MAG: hypothetical protein R3B06_26895 [Kofleriaceae bacterium]
MIQQADGVNLYDGVGQAGDRYERHADLVADRVVAGQSAADLFGQGPIGGAARIQRQAVVQRTGEVSDRDYLRDHADDLLRALPAILRGLPLRLSHPQATLREGQGAALMDAITGQLGPGQAGLDALAALMPGESLQRAVERGRPHASIMLAPSGHPELAEPVRTNDGSADWRPEVAQEAAATVHRTVQASLTRAGGRYVTAHNAAMQRAWAAARATDPTITVSVDPAAVIPGHPMDRVVIPLLCTGTYLTVGAPSPDQPATDEVLRPCQFHFLGSEGLQAWVRVTPADARAEEVAASLYGDAARADTLTGRGGMWQFAPGLVLEAYRDQLTGSEVDGFAPVDSTASLASPLADEIALAQAGESTGGEPATVLRDMRDSVRIMDGMIEQAGTYGPMVDGGGLRAARDRVDTRSTTLATQPATATATWAAQAQQQREVVALAATGLDQSVVQLGSMTDLATDRGAHNLPGYVRELILAIAQRYTRAAVFSDQAATSRAYLEEAEQRSRTYPLDLMDHILQEIQQSMADVRPGEGHAAEASGHQATQARLRERLVALRARVLADPGSLGDELQVLMGEIQDLQQGSSMVANMDAIDSAMAVLDDTNGFWAWISGYSGELSTLRTEGAGYHARWRTIYTAWQGGDQAQARAGLDALRADDGFRSYLGRVQDEVHDARVAQAIAQLIAVLAITVATMGVGAYVAGAAAGAGWSAGAVAAAQVTAEAATFTALNTALFERDPTVTGVAGEFVFNLALFGALRSISTVARAGAMGRAIEAGGAAGRTVVAAEMTSQYLLMTVAGMVRDDLSRRARDQPPATDEELRGMFLENLAMFIITAVIGNMLRRPLLEPLERAGGRWTTRAAQLRAARAALGARGEELRGSRDLAAARRLLGEERVVLEDEQAAFRAFQEEIEAAPAEERARLLEERGVTEAEYAEMMERAETTDAHLSQMRRAELLATLEPIGPNLFAAPREQVPELLQSHQQQGARVELESQDPVTRERTYLVRYEDGQQLRIVERFDGGRPGTPGERVPTEAEAALARAEAQRALARQDARNAQLQGLVDAAPVVEVEHLIGGGGVAATMDYATLPALRGAAVPGADVTELPSTFAVGGREAWRARAEGLAAAAAEHGVSQPLLEGGRIGQPVDNWANGGFTRQPGEFTADHTALGRAADVADAVTMTQFETGMVIYDGAVVSIEINPNDGTWPSNKPVRARVASPSHPDGEFFIYAGSIDAALGRGAARSLEVDTAEGAGDRQVSPADLDVLLADQRLVYYDDMFRHPARGRVLVVGGGPTAVWAAGTVAEVGSQAVVLGRPSTDARAVEARTRLAGNDVELARIEAELAFEATRQVVAGRFFDNPNIEFRAGRLGRVRPGDAPVPEEAGKIMVQIDGAWQPFDQVALSIGQDPAGGSVNPDGTPGASGAPGIGQVLGSLQLRMVIVDGRLVGLESLPTETQPAGLVRVLGASMSESITRWVVESERALFTELVRTTQPNDPNVPVESRGVQDSIYQLGQNIPAANGELGGGPVDGPFTRPPIPAPRRDEDDDAPTPE